MPHQARRAPWTAHPCTIGQSLTRSLPRVPGRPSTQPGLRIGVSPWRGFMVLGLDLTVLDLHLRLRPKISSKTATRLLETCCTSP